MAAESTFSGRLAIDGLVVERTDNEYVDGPVGLTQGGLTDPRWRRFTRKTTTHTAAMASSCRVGVGSPPPPL